MVKLKADYWQALIKECEASGLTHSDFCRQKGIPVAKFKYRWRTEMELNSTKERIESKRMMAVPKFEEISISGADSLPRTQIKLSVIKIQLPNQIHCEFQISVSEPEFCIVLKQLVALC